MENAYNIIFLIGRIMVGGFFIMNGVHHFTDLKMMSGYAKAKGTPAPVLAVGGTGVLLLLGGASLLLGYHPTIGAILLAIFLTGVSLSIHNFWAIKDEQAKAMEKIQFEKNIAILGLVLMTLLIPRPWAFSIGNW